MTTLIRVEDYIVSEPGAHDIEFNVDLAECWLGSSHRDDTKRVWSVRVPDKLQGRGLGRRLMRVVCAWADANGSSLDLFVYSDNKRAIHLYLSVGFEITNTIEPDRYRIETAHRYGWPEPVSTHHMRRAASCTSSSTS